MRRRRIAPVIAFIGGRTIVPITARERAQIPQQRILARQEIARLKALEIAALQRSAEEESPPDKDAYIDEERQAIQDEPPDVEFDMPDWDSEFFEEWDDEIEYELFTILS